MKVNLHIVEACNYKCKHCFAHFYTNGILSLELDDWKRVIDNFIKSGIIDSFNIAGGEPLLYPQLHELVEYINKQGLTCSIITNGSLITGEWVKDNAKLYDTIGISIDSFDENTNLELGRADSLNNSISFEKICDIFYKIKKENPGCKLKINTVVSSMNKDEIICKYINKLPVNRYKIIKISEYDDNKFSNTSLTINDDEFNSFLKRNLYEFGIIFNDLDDDVVKYNIDNKKIVVEKTTKSSYYIVSPQGLVLDNTYDKSYKYIGNLLTDDFLDVIKRLNFSYEIYNARY